MLLAHCNVVQIYFDHRHVHISPESDFPSAYIFILTVTTVASTYYLINIRAFKFCGKPTAEPDL